MEFQPTKLPGCFEIFPAASKDARGSFVKFFHQRLFAENGLETRFVEDFYSVSRQGVLRGLHFQTPPHAGAKLVACLSGSVLDAVVDLRVGSPAYGRFATFTLNAEKGTLLYVPAGFAHGFYVTQGPALTLYKAASLHDAAHDAGIKWDSAGIPWPDSSPLISERDGRFPSLADFKSPFLFSSTAAP